ncbi:MAG: sigma 54-interacting transcriptional regulator [Pseudomonadota bacterium]
MTRISEASCILLAEDDAAIRNVLIYAFEQAGYKVCPTVTLEGLQQMVVAGKGDLVIADVVMPDGNGLDQLPGLCRMRPDLPIIIITARADLVSAVRACKAGAYEYVPKPFDLDYLLALVRTCLSEQGQRTIKAANASTQSYSSKKSGQQSGLPGGKSPAMQLVYRLVARSSRVDFPVLIIGESGTGKELVARSIHRFSNRAAMPFIALNMASIPRELIESELFGHEKGAFTGALSRRQGQFELAAGGTLFLDEIGDMALEAQTRLLRVLQEGEFIPVGATRTIKADIRIIAATHRDLGQMVKEATFREDLFYRLNVIPLTVPPLRLRKDDIPDLVQGFLDEMKIEGIGHKYFSSPAIKALRSYHWPGNVRELKNLVQRLCVLVPGSRIDARTVREALSLAPLSSYGVCDANGSDPEAGLEALIDRYLDQQFANADHDPPCGLYRRMIDRLEHSLLTATLKACQGNQVRAAQILGLHRNTLRQKLVRQAIVAQDTVFLSDKEAR